MQNLKTVSPSPNKTHQGKTIESVVANYLQKQGVHLLYRNFRCRLGEIDLIGLYEDSLIFAEVRSRKNAYYGDPAASVTVRKQQKLRNTARFFLAKYPKMALCACRFDVVAVTLDETLNKGLKIEWIKNAFY